MKYHSTRSHAPSVSFTAAILTGLAPDGGLYIPSRVPSLPKDYLKQWLNLPFHALAFNIMRHFIDPAEIPDAELKKLTEKSFSTFRHKDVTPLKVLRKDESFYVLELFHGPTFAFKDVALQFLGNLFEYFLLKKARNEPNTSFIPSKITVVGATSGDTGSAAIYGLRGKKNVNVCILHPRGKVSPVQEAQMTTVLDENVCNVSIEGTFDDCQDIVKAMFNTPALRKEFNLAAINSINWARILAQITYYFSAYFQFIRTLPASSSSSNPPKIKFAVPTGNFGDILAGYYASLLGLPIQQLIIATNKNSILHRFLQSPSGIYARQEAQESLSPAMDISVASNFERVLWYWASRVLAGADGVKACAIVKGWMDNVKKTGRLEVGEKVVLEARKLFDSVAVTDDQIISTIASYHSKTGYLLDPHTAVGAKAAEVIKSKDKNISVPIIILSTAHPAKFPAAVQSALPSLKVSDINPPEFRGLLQKPKKLEHISYAGERGMNSVADLLRRKWGKKSVL